MDQTTGITCGEPITRPATGRRRLYCSDSCRQHASRRSRSTYEPVVTAHGTCPAPGATTTR